MCEVMCNNRNGPGALLIFNPRTLPVLLSVVVFRLGWSNAAQALVVPALPCAHACERSVGAASAPKQRTHARTHTHTHTQLRQTAETER